MYIYLRLIVYVCKKIFKDDTAMVVKKQTQRLYTFYKRYIFPPIYTGIYHHKLPSVRVTV